jgi:hypothetical protein
MTVGSGRRWCANLKLIHKVATHWRNLRGDAQVGQCGIRVAQMFRKIATTHYRQKTRNHPSGPGK